MNVILRLMDALNEATQPDLFKHRLNCTCSSCEEYHKAYEQYNQMLEGGLLDADMRPPRPRGPEHFQF